MLTLITTLVLAGPGCFGDLPRGFKRVTSAEAEGHCIAIAASHAIDPVGEMGWGGYWLFEGADGIWDSGTYLNLRMNHPYVVEEAQPTLRAGVLGLTVHEQRIDDGFVTFPPTAMRYDERSRSMALALKLSDLRRDSDGDGMTDLEERRLLLDPRDPDTDHDGRPDGKDWQPNISNIGPASAETDMVGRALDFLVGKRLPAVIVDVPHPARGTAFSMPPMRRDAPIDVVYLHADPGSLSGLRCGLRIIAVTDEAYETSASAFGIYLPMTVRATLRDGKARVEWSEGWRGGELEGHQTDGVWEFATVSSWIT